MSSARPDETALDRLCLTRIARIKRFKSYRFVANLPKNSYGKCCGASCARGGTAD